MGDWRIHSNIEGIQKMMSFLQSLDLTNPEDVQTAANHLAARMNNALQALQPIIEGQLPENISPERTNTALQHFLAPLNAQPIESRLAGDASFINATIESSGSPKLPSSGT